MLLLYISEINRMTLIIQILIIFFISLIFCVFKNFDLGAFSMLGGISAFLPNFLFYRFLIFIKNKKNFSFLFKFITAEIIKIFFIFIFFIFAVILCKKIYFSFLITWIITLLIQIIISIKLTNKT